MKFLFFFLLGSIPLLPALAQDYNVHEPDTFYYPFENGIQMIEIAFPQKVISEVRYDYRNRDFKYKNHIKNIYIFRNKKGKILHIFNQGEHKITSKQLRSTKEENYVPDFLKYQYIKGQYLNKRTGKIEYFFTYSNKHGLIGLFNQYGKIVLPAKYKKIQQISNNAILLRMPITESIFFLDDRNAKINLLFSNLKKTIYKKNIDYPLAIFDTFNGLYGIIDLEYKKILLLSSSPTMLYYDKIRYNMHPVNFINFQSQSIDNNFKTRPPQIIISGPQAID